MFLQDAAGLRKDPRGKLVGITVVPIKENGKGNFVSFCCIRFYMQK